MIGSRRTVGEDTTPTPVLASPTNLITTTITETSIGLSWVSGDAVNTDDYVVYINTVNDFGTATQDGTTVTTTYTISGLTGSTTYYIFVVGRGGGFINSNPANVQATTSAGAGGLISPIINSATPEGSHRMIFSLSFDNGAGNIEDVEITRTSTNGTTVLTIPVGQAGTYVVGGLSPSVQYTWDFVSKATGQTDSTASQHIETMGAAPAKDSITRPYQAYSFRNNWTAYTGDFARVRRDSDDTYTTIGFLANGAIDLEALESFCAGSNGFAYPYDSGTAGEDLIESVTTGTGYKVYDSIKGCSGYFGTTGTLIKSTSNTPATNTAFSAMLSLKTSNTVGDAGLFLTGDLFGAGNKGSIGVQGGKFYGGSVLYGNTKFETSALSTNTKYKCAYTKPNSTNSGVTYLNGVSDATNISSFPVPYVPTNSTIEVFAGTEFGNGWNSYYDIEEILVHKSDQNANVASVNTNQTNYFG